MSYKKPQAESIVTDEICEYGCGTQAKYIFWNGKKCCAASYNSCLGKRKAFSNLDHTDRTAKSLDTRIKQGITKTSQIKGGATRRAQGHYQNLAKKMSQHWQDRPWENNTQCPIIEFKETGITFQGTYEYEFLEELEVEFGLDWITLNVKRGPSVWYIDPTDNSKRLYISDFIINNTIYEIKSSWTWNKHGKDPLLEKKNKAKLTECINQGYNVVLVLNQKRINYEGIMDGALPP
jgi:hypothetical protein